MRIVMLTSLIVLACLGVVSTSQCEDYLYTPQKAVEGSPVAEDAVRVREITVKKGDTLSHLSKKYAGRGRYYPQILLFNKIKNPHRIRKGQVLRVPLYGQSAMAGSHGAAVPAGATEEQPVVAGQQLQAVTAVSKSPESGDSTPVEKQVVKKKVGRKERLAYQKAVKLYTKGDCAAAVILFDRFTTRYPSSSLAPEVSLKRADCYLKLSAAEK